MPEYPHVDPHALRIGERVARARRRSDLTQFDVVGELNARPGIQTSHSWYSKMERGTRLLDSYRIINALADIFECTVNELMGQPYGGGTEPAPEHRGIPAIEEAVLTAGRHVVYTAADLRPMEQLDEAFSRQVYRRQNAQFSRFNKAAPELLHRLHAVAELGSGDDRLHAYELLTETYHGILQTTKKLGYLALSSIAADRAAETAQCSGNDLLVMINRWNWIELHFKAGRTNAADRLVEETFPEVEALASDRAEPAVWSLLGTLHMMKAIAGAQWRQRDDVRVHLAEADRIAEIVGAGRDDYQTMFGAPNIQIFRLSTAAEQQEPGAALENLDRFDVESIPNVERTARYWIDVSRLHTVAGHSEAALDALWEAHDAAPEDARNHPMVRGVVETLSRQARSGYRERLSDLADVVGVVI